MIKSQKCFDKFLNIIFSVNLKGMLISREIPYYVAIATRGAFAISNLGMKISKDFDSAMKDLNTRIIETMHVPEECKGKPSNSSASVEKAKKAIANHLVG